MDDVTAWQSRRGTNAKRFKDGSLRPNRPRPPPGSLPAMQRSPRQPYVKPDHVMYWPSAGGGGASTATTTMAGYAPREIPGGLVVPTRHGFSPRNNVGNSSVGEHLFNDKTSYMMRPGEPMMAARPVVVSPRAAPLPPIPADDLHRARVNELEIAVRHERRMIEFTRAALTSQLRRELDIGQRAAVASHDPAASP